MPPNTARPKPQSSAPEVSLSPHAMGAAFKSNIWLLSGMVLGSFYLASMNFWHFSWYFALPLTFLCGLGVSIRHKFSIRQLSRPLSDWLFPAGYLGMVALYYLTAKCLAIFWHA